MTSMAHEEFEDLYGLYVLGSLTPAEQTQLETHLHTGCATCRESIPQVREVFALLPYSLPLIPPPPEGKQKLLEKIQREEGLRFEEQKPRPGRTKEGKRRFLAPLWTLAVACLVLFLGRYTFLLYREVSLLKEELVQQQKETDLWKNQLTRQKLEDDLLKNQLMQQQQDLNALRDELIKLRSYMAMITAPSVKTVNLVGSAKSREARGKIFLDPIQHRALFYAYHLPSIPPGKTYQLWVIKDKPVSAGVFSVDSEGNAFLEVSGLLTEVEKIKAIAVTLEPAGGLPQPSGDKYLVGS